MPVIRIIFTTTLIELLAVPQQVTAVASTTAARDLHRSSDEVMFNHLQTSRIMTDVWHHTTLSVLPSHKNWLRRYSDCSILFQNHNVTFRDRLSFLCHRFSQRIEAMNVIYGHTSVYLHAMKQEIRDTIPTTLDLSDDYQKRHSLRSWIGSGLSSMFGLVNEDQIKQMKDSVQSMLEASGHIMQEMKTFSDHVSTYVKAKNERLDGLVESLKTVQSDAFAYAHVC